jgi:hypothetical protein
MIKAKQAAFGPRTRVVAIAMFLATFAGLGGSAPGQEEEPQFTTEFRFKDCKFKHKGVNPFFILKPGYQLIFEGEEDGDTLRVVKTVLHETEIVIVPGLGRIRTRVLKEQEYLNGRLVEESRNFFAICEKTNDVVYFGEEVDIFLPDGTIVHDGAWRAGVDGALPGLIMPGTFLLGSRYFQEQAPDAMDRAEHVEMGITIETEAGTFNGCVRVVETTPLEPGAESEKIYCPGVGLVVDDIVELVEINSKKNGNGHHHDED